MKLYELVVFVNNNKKNEPVFLYEVYPQGSRFKSFEGFRELYTLDLSSDERKMLSRAVELNKSVKTDNYLEKIFKIVIIEQEKRLRENYVKSKNY